MTDSQKPLVSIITVVYNGASTIEQTIQSVINQTYKNIEYIIIDGASNDGTQDIISKYNDNIALFVSEKDNGIYDAMNKGIGLANGEIIGIINSDDWYETDAVENTVKAFSKSTSISVVYGDINLVESNGEIRKHNQVPFAHLSYEMSVSHPATFVKRSVYEKYGHFDISYKIASDFDLMNRFYNNRLQFAHVRRIISNFRLSGISNTQKDICHRETSTIIEKYFKFNLFARICQEKFSKNNAPIFVFGAGNWGRRVILSLKLIQFDINRCIDNDNTKWGTEVEGVVVSSPEILNGFASQVLISSMNYEENIIAQLKKMELDKCHMIKISECVKEYETVMARCNGECMEIYD